MTPTDALIAQLSADTAMRPAPGARAFAVPLLALMFASAAVLTLLLGRPIMLEEGVLIMPLIVKWGFFLILAWAALAALHALAHPGRRADLLLALALTPLVLAAALAAISPSGPSDSFPGTTWQTCLAAMSIIGAAGFAAAIHAARRFAPVKLRRAGLAAGLLGGGLAAIIYSPFCPERGAAFLLAFYVGPITALAALGWLSGPRLLRW